MNTSVFYAACNGKRKMPYHEAVRVATRMRRQREERITEYRCQGCGWWHVGNRVEHDAVSA